VRITVQHLQGAVAADLAFVCQTYLGERFDVEALKEALAQIKAAPRKLGRTGWVILSAN
jgi:hypothetical protein